MKRLLPVLALFAVLCGCCSCGRVIPTDGEVAVVPLPEHIVEGQGTFRLTSDAEVVLLFDDERLAGVTAALNEVLMPLFGRGPRVRHADKAADHAVNVTRDETMPAEAYRLFVTPCRIDIVAGGAQGAFYAVQTLRQLFPAAAYEADDVRAVELPVVTIEDKPCLGYRGMMLDVGRHFFTVDEVKEALDIMALHKLNVFHWHLTEGLGWRVEIKQYPLLTQKGAYAAVGEEQQGFYSQEEIKALVDYAAARNITIVPEIDMPGHAEAALHSYPELGCFNRPVEIPKLGFTPNIFCAGKENTLQFLKNVLDEICTLFPSSYIHLGGDEAPKDNWNKCPDCQKRITDLGLKNSHDLQLWFSAQMAEHLKSKGKKAIFWGDVVYNDGYPLPDNIVIQWWNYRGHKDLALRNALRHHYPVICSTNYYTYLNFPLTPWKGYEQARTFDLKDVYMNNPSYKATQESNPLIRGMGCALWTDDGVKEYMIDRRLFPRILALAEQMWHNGPLMDFDAFYQRILHKKKWFENRGYGFGPALTEETDNNYKWE